MPLWKRFYPALALRTPLRISEGPAIALKSRLSWRLLLRWLGASDTAIEAGLNMDGLSVPVTPPSIHIRSTCLALGYYALFGVSGDWHLRDGSRGMELVYSCS